MKRRRKHRLAAGVELNLAAMLDMAFQLLAFFILTYQNVPSEKGFLLRLPPPQAITPGPTVAPPGTDPGKPISNSLRTVVVTVAAEPADGSIASLQLGDSIVATVNRLEQRLKELFSADAVPFDQVLIHVDSRLNYAALISVVDACTRQDVLENGRWRPLAKLSFVEMQSE